MNKLRKELLQNSIKVKHSFERVMFLFTGTFEALVDSYCREKNIDSSKLDFRFFDYLIQLGYIPYVRGKDLSLNRRGDFKDFIQDVLIQEIELEQYQEKLSEVVDKYKLNCCF